MSALKRLSFVLLLVVLSACSSVQAPRSFPSRTPDEPPGVVVDSVDPRSAAAVAGLLPGDLILGFDSPFDLIPLEIEVAPRRPVTLRGRRGGEERTWVLASGDWGLVARPVAATPDGDGPLAAWFLERKAREHAEARQWPEADALYPRVVEALEREGDLAAAAHVLRAWGDTFNVRGDRAAAADRFRKALEVERRIAPKSLGAAETLLRLGYAAAKSQDLETGEALVKQALAIQEELAPGSVAVANTLRRLGILFDWRGDLDAAAAHLLRAQELYRRLAPESFGYGMTFTNLGNVAKHRGDLVAAESWHRQALAHFERIGKEDGALAGCLQNLVGLAIERGDLATADDLLRRVLEIQERRGAGEWESWSALLILGSVASERGDLDAAEVHYRRALAMQEKKPSPDGSDLALSLGSLGELALLKRDFASARDYLRRAQEIRERLDPASLDSAEGLRTLARLETEEGGDLARAEELLRRALAIVEREAPESVQSSLLLRSLGEVAGRRGRAEEALALFRRALDLQGRIVPGSMEMAKTLNALGRAERQAGRAGEGSRDLCRAIDVLDSQRNRLGGTQEARASFEATLGGYYHDCLEALVEAGRTAEAFHVLERGRARSFLALLAERDVQPSDLPPELAAERGRVNAEYDRVQARLAALSAGRDDAEILRLTGELRDLRLRQEQVFDRIRRESPRSAALEDPEPLDLAGAREALDPGTVLLEYAVGKERSWLFVVGKDLSVFPLAVGAERLREQVEGFRLLLKDPGSSLAEIQDRARRLYDLLVLPAQTRIAGAERILVSPDGPLLTLPFATLRDGDRYLVESKPIHNVLSATVYAELARSRRPRRPEEGRVAAFGDPVYRALEPDAPADPEVREAVRRGLALTPLPFSGREVKAIAELFPRAEVYLGSEATEERAKSLGTEARLVHFACHGLIDERFPLNSALALTAEGDENGLLQAWEIFESVRLDADLVTLSACDTALGREMGGEGLVGLTRAFQYAGARSVLASLWSVADVSTARFMKSFYGHLRGGMSKDEALRAAQVEQAKDLHPFHWAAFQLTGDWK